MKRRILVTSATGLTGCAIVKELSLRGHEVRAMVHSESRKDEMLSLGAFETVVASIDNATDLERAMNGVDTVVYICPTAHPEEGAIGCMAIDVAERMGVSRFIYQSVHNSIEPDLPHHRQKLMVEQHLLVSGLHYSILRPTAFMQNVTNASELLKEKHIFAQKFYFSTDSDNLINLVDVEDYAKVAAEVVTNEKYDYGCFDICGPRNLSAMEMVDTIREVTSHNILFKYISDEEFINISHKKNMPEYSVKTLIAMFRAYNKYGFKGNGLTTETILGRTPTGFKEFLSTNLK